MAYYWIWPMGIESRASISATILWPHHHARNRVVVSKSQSPSRRLNPSYDENMCSSVAGRSWCQFEPHSSGVDLQARSAQVLCLAQDASESRKRQGSLLSANDPNGCGKHGAVLADVGKRGAGDCANDGKWPLPEELLERC